MRRTIERLRSVVKKGMPPVACHTNAMLFVFRLFSFVITDAGTQLRKYLAGDVYCCAARQPGRIFLFNDCAFVYLHQREFSSGFTTRKRRFLQNRVLDDFARGRSMWNENLFSATFRICGRRIGMPVERLLHFQCEVSRGVTCSLFLPFFLFYLFSFFFIPAFARLSLPF